MRGARGHKGCQNQTSKADYKIENLMMIENLNQPDWTIWRQGPEGVKEGCYGAQNLTSTTSRRVITSNEYLMSLVYRLSTPNY